jgi:hypothetical protein
MKFVSESLPLWLLLREVRVNDGLDNNPPAPRRRTLVDPALQSYDVVGSCGDIYTK